MARRITQTCGGTAGLGALALAWLAAAQADGTAAAGIDSGWTAYGGTPAQTHYSALTQVDRDNVAQLRVAWVYDTGDAFGSGALASEMQCNPIVVGRVLFGISPRLRVFAVDAATGAPKWSFDPNDGRPVLAKRRSRGVTYWSDGRDARIFFGAGHHLYALDATNGRPIDSFGVVGRVDLREELDRPAADQSVSLTTPPVVYRDLVIVGGAVSETLPSSPGYIRAYDARSGRLRWRFRTIPAPGESAFETWPATAHTRAGGANNWAGMALDQRRGLLFVPTGSAAFDFYGGDRRGDNLFANTLLALDAATGRRIWHFQFVHHDLWDRDLPAPPTLVTVRRDGRNIDAVAQVTKSGHVFVFERDTGRPLFPIREAPAPDSDVPGEHAARTQPVPESPAPFARQLITEDDVTRRTPEAHDAVLRQLQGLRNGAPFTPPSLQGTVLLPGLDGGAEWGGPSYDPSSGVLYVNANEMAWVLQLVRRPQSARAVSGRTLYEANCAPCHLPSREGSPPQVPTLVGIGERWSRQEITLTILTGGARMPAFQQLGLPGAEAVAEYLLSGRDVPVSRAATSTPADHRSTASGAGNYLLNGYRKLLDPDGYPAISPPWGTLTAIDLSSGLHRWQVPLGEYPELARAGQPTTGTENYGGAVVTAGGLLFIAATVYDDKFRAFDKDTGRMLWETQLPAAGHATPAVYQVDGKQFIVVSAGGGKNPKGRSAGSLVAFALP
jgi:quinoprotein glucose dehydrogenase